MTLSLSFAAFAAAARLERPEVAFVLGSGLGEVARRLGRAQGVPFAEVPGLPAAGVAGHRGRLTLGDWAGRRVLVFEGRVHYYEGHAWRDVVAPVRTAAFLGARVLVLTNAAGGIHESLGPGSLMAVRDHVEWTRPYCWRLPGPGALGPPRPSPYSPRLRGLLHEAARGRGVDLHEGVYAAVTGPCFETPAEIRALRAWGADAVGMSTAREVQAGHEAGRECAAVSCVTNRAAGLAVGTLTHEEVLTTAAAQSERLAGLLEGFLERLGGENGS
jgi:purine-nucleoside phosphorylase